MGTALVLALFLAVCGLIAYLGDVIGRRFGKKRLSLFGLRPRHTAVLITTFTGVVIAGCTLAFAYGVSPVVRVAVLEGDRLLFEIPRLQAQVREAEESLAEARRQERELDETNRALTAENQALLAQNQELLADNTALQERNRELQARSEQLEARSRLLTARNDELLARNDRLGAQNEELTAANDELNATLAVQRDQYAALRSRYDVLYREQEALTDAQAELARELGAIQEAMRDAREQLDAERANLEQTRTDLRNAEQSVRQLELSARDLMEQVDELHDTNRELQAENSGLAAENQNLQEQARVAGERLQQEQQRLTDAERRVAAAETRVSSLQRETELLEGRIKPYEEGTLIYTAGQELARRPLPAGHPPEIVRSVIEGLLFEANYEAERAGARPELLDGPSTYLDLEIFDSVSGSLLPPQDENHAIALLERDVLRQGGGWLFRAVAARNVPEGTPVPLYITLTQMRVVAEQGDEIASVTLDPRARDQLWSDVMRFLQTEVRARLLDLGIIPTAQMELAQVDWDNIAEVIREVRSRRERTTVRVVARSVVWNSGTPDLDLRVDRGGERGRR